jgi:hypothetical protein
MAINRFYRPSQPAYTSQFVEDQYPVDLMLQQGAMKYSQAQQFYENVGKLSALNSTLTPGYRTTRMAPAVRNKYENMIQDFTSKYSDSYDSPQALMELSRLRNTWSNDPDVQLIMYDREIGNQERNKMLQDTDTYHLDIDKNVDPESGTLKQFNPGDPYIGYQPLVKYVDIPKYVEGLYEDVPWEKGTMLDRRKVVDPLTRLKSIVETKRNVRQRTLDTFKPTIQTLINRYRQGGEEWSEYMRARLGDDVSDEQLEQYFTNLAIPKVGYEYTDDQDIKTMRDVMGKDYKPEGPGESYTLAGSAVPQDENIPRINDIREGQLKRIFLKGDHDPFSNDLLYNTFIRAAKEEKPDILEASRDEQLKFFAKYLKDKDASIYDTYKYNVEVVDSDTKKEKENTLFGGNVVNGKLNADVTSPILMGARLYNYKGGNEMLDEEEKSGLLTEGTSVNYIGPLADDYMAPEPNMHVVAIGENTYLMSDTREGSEKKRAMWNLAGSWRATSSGMGNTFVMELKGGADTQDPVAIHDHTQYDEYEGDYNNIDYDSPSSLYVKSVHDYNDNKTKVKVYARNPKDYKILSNENPFFIKEYDLSESGGIGGVYRKILEERDDLLKGKLNAYRTMLGTE